MADEFETPTEINRVEQVDLNLEMQRSYLDYAMSVIVGRALPDVSDGLKPVHRRVLYAMYDGGYRPDRNFSKCARVVGDVMGQYHPHGDSAIYDALVRLVQPWTMRYPLIAGQGNFGSPGDDGAAAPRYTECKLAPLAMEMVRDIDEDTVDFQPNYDGRASNRSSCPRGSRTCSPTVRPASPWAWRRTSRRTTSANSPPALSGRSPTPRRRRKRRSKPSSASSKAPTSRSAPQSSATRASRTPTGPVAVRSPSAPSSRSRRSRVGPASSSPSRLYMVNPDTLAAKIASYVKDGKVAGIADLRDESSGRTGQRLVIVLKRDAVAKVVLNNLYKHTSPQENFSANMLALVDNVPRTLSLDSFLRLWVKHQIEVIVRRTKFRLRKAEERAHILRGYLKALDALDEVIALIRRSPSSDEARAGLMELLEVDELQANAILDLPAAPPRGPRAAEDPGGVGEDRSPHRRVQPHPRDPRPAAGDRLRGARRGRRTLRRRPADEDPRRLRWGRVDGGPHPRGGGRRHDHPRRVRQADPVDALPRAHRGGKGIKGAQPRGDDVVEQFFVTSTHNWLLFFTNTGRVYRAKAYEIPEGSRDAKGQHVANLLALQPGETIAKVLSIRDYDEAEFLILATKSGVVKKTRLSEYDSNRTGGVIAINLREYKGEPDELVSARIVSSEDHLLLISRKGMSIRFAADDDSIRPLGRVTGGVTGMKFKDDDELLTMDVVQPGTYVFVVTEGGYAKRTPVDEYRVQGRGGLGIRVAKITEQRGDLVGGLIVDEGEEVLVVMERGKVVRSNIDEVPAKGRNTMGVVFAKPGKNDRIIAVTRGPETAVEDEDEAEAVEAEVVAPEAETPEAVETETGAEDVEE